LKQIYTLSLNPATLAVSANYYSKVSITSLYHFSYYYTPNKHSMNIDFKHCNHTN